jgi:hypothetical protein
LDVGESIVTTVRSIIDKDVVWLDVCWDLISAASRTRYLSQIPTGVNIAIVMEDLQRLENPSRNVFKLLPV